MMEISIEAVVMTILGLWLGSSEWRMRNMDTRLREAPSRKEVEKQIDLKQEVVKSDIEHIKDSQERIEEKLDKLLTK